MLLPKDLGEGLPEGSGIKIPLAKIFEPFYTTKEDRVGLGLAIVKKIIEGHNGRIEVESEEGRVTRFVVIL
ncbi:hypothetical protein A2282_07125 [candidate division WOR-1 bacterium RIFOXYA12_FULL_36_13]|nr:MAG: hypothetical protein A2282_07125 [candidate division WOR-1 bacterium RIFOXYA12_FULL_36_13]